MEDRLILSAVASDPTLLALDFDPKGRWFEFEAEIAQMPGGVDHYPGLFFGYRCNGDDPTRRYSFLALKLDESPRGDANPSSLLFGSMYFDPGGGGVIGPEFNSFRAFPGAKGNYQLPPANLKEQKGWRHIRVRALDDRITVAVDHDPKPLVSLDLAELNAPCATCRGLPLDPRGALGIWQHKGRGMFRNILVAALPSEQIGR